MFSVLQNTKQISKYNLQRHNTLFHVKYFDKHKDKELTCVVENMKREVHNKDEIGRVSVPSVRYKVSVKLK